MSTPIAHGAVKPMKVDQVQFLGTIWSLLGIAIICSALRFLVRLRIFKKLLMDDYFVIAALVFAIANAIIWQIYAPSLYYVMSVSAGLEIPGPQFASIMESYMKATLGVIFLYYSALWAIKLSFLVFFKRLGTNVTKQKWLWWPIFLFTIATYFACIGNISYPCLSSSADYIETHCANQQAGRFNQVTLKVNCALDVISDFLIMLIPIHLLHGVQISVRRKFALMGIFSLVIITMIFAIIRTALVGSPHSSLPDSSWLYMWSAIEVSVAIMVTSGTSFRNLFYRGPSAPPQSFKSFPVENRPRNRVMELIDTLASTDMQFSTHSVQIRNTEENSGPILEPNHGANLNGEIASKSPLHSLKEESSVDEQQV